MIPRLHVITDAVVQSRHDHAALARLALDGGADCVQFRDKRPLATAVLAGIAKQIVRECARHGALAVVNDRADVALAAAAGGVHLGRNDLDIGTARRILGDGVVIGGTANSYEEALRVCATDVDYVGVGPVYGTRSKANPAPDLGLATLARIVQDCPKPIIAIGGIDADNVAAVMAAGAHGVAVLGAVVGAADPVAAVAALRIAMAPEGFEPADRPRGR